jgi:hypothetical protein
MLALLRFYLSWGQTVVASKRRFCLDRGSSATCADFAMRYRYAAMQTTEWSVVGSLNSYTRRKNTKAKMGSRYTMDELAHTSLCKRIA